MSKKEEFRLPRYFRLTEEELIGLILCLSLDIIEYVLRILLLPVAGDLIDIVGVILCLYLFRWVGAIALLELVPGLDILPIYLITWLFWYYLKKMGERRKKARFR